LANPLDFATVEAALVSQLIADVDEFTAENMKAHDVDSVFLFALSDSNVDFFAWTDYAGGQNQGRGIWEHNIALTVGIFYSEGVNLLDDNIRTVVTAIQASLLPDTRLSDAVPSARIESIGSPVPWENIENNSTWVSITFNIVADEQMRTGSAR